MLPFSSVGVSSGEIGVSTMSSSVLFTLSSVVLFAVWRTMCLIMVFGSDALTPYMLIWSPLYVAQPNASSDRSPVPITMPFSWLAMSMRICVRSLACEFSYVTSWLLMSWSISLKCCMQASFIDMSLIFVPSACISASALLYVRSLVPNPGIVTVVMLLCGNPSRSHALAMTSRARVESSPPEKPITQLFAPVCAIRFASAMLCMSNASSQYSSTV